MSYSKTFIILLIIIWPGGGCFNGIKELLIERSRLLASCHQQLIPIERSTFVPASQRSLPPNPKKKLLFSQVLSHLCPNNFALREREREGWHLQIFRNSMGTQLELFSPYELGRFKLAHRSVRELCSRVLQFFLAFFFLICLGIFMCASND